MGDDDDRSESDEGRRPSRGGGSVKAQIRTMPKWQKLVLSLALLATALGAAGWVAGRVGDRANRQAAAPTAADVPAPPGASQLLTRSGAPNGSESATAEEPGFAVRVSPKVMRVGVSVIVGFVIGFLFRMFVKTMLLVTIVIGGIFFALTYFNVVNVDLTAAQESYANVMEWVTDQAARLKDVVVAHLPSSASGGLGAFIGFRRR
jgi:uncharacterized membrane protein (Fun14 family)